MLTENSENIWQIPRGRAEQSRVCLDFLLTRLPRKWAAVPPAKH